MAWHIDESHHDAGCGRDGKAGLPVVSIAVHQQITQPLRALVQNSFTRWQSFWKRGMAAIKLARPAPICHGRTSAGWLLGRMDSQRSDNRLRLSHDGGRRALL